MTGPAPATLPGTPDAPWCAPAGRLVQTLGTDAARGLDDAEARRRLRDTGPNRLRTRPPRPAWRILRDQFASLLVALLLAGAGLAFLLGEWVEGNAILVVLLLNGTIGFVMELRAVRSMEALRALERARATVRRQGRVAHVPAETLVPGDIVLLEGGDVVTADLRLLEASKLQADESTLTGESLPVAKRSGTLHGELPLAERANMVFKGTAVTRGSGTGLVIATGMQTELGRITHLVVEAVEEETPLERRLAALGRRLVWATLLIAAAVAATGILGGEDPYLIIETAIALAVAAVPEGLPIIATITLARGMHRMSRRNAVVNRLSAVETLGATTVILTDKTGTLTENRLLAERVLLERGEADLAAPATDDALRRLLEAGVLCNDADLTDTGAVGDPIDVALLELGARFGVARAALLAEWPEVHEEAFDPDLRLMGTVHSAGGGTRVAVKGAPEAVLDLCVAVGGAQGPRPLDAGAVRQWLDRNEALSAGGLRVIAVAERRDPGHDVRPYHDLVLLGLVGIADPPREDVAEVLRTCRRAGIRVVMATGDHGATALAIARRVGLVEPDADERPLAGAELAAASGRTAAETERLRRARIFARMSPAQKLDLIDLHQRGGEVVAMTGDGVNDAPALTRADVGIAMGRRGTEVAREAADIVLRDDAFATIVTAIREGRVIFSNLRAFVYYLLSCNLSEIAVIGIATAVGAPLPLLPLQILFLNLVTDVFPALALGLGEGDARVLERPPRDPRTPLLAGRHWWTIVGYGALLTAAVLAAQQVALRRLQLGPEVASSVAFLTLALAQLWHVFNMRAARSGLLRNAVVRNPWVWGALALCVPLVLATVYLPGLARVLGVSDPGQRGWSVVLGLSVLPLVLGQAVRLLRRPRPPGRPGRNTATPVGVGLGHPIEKDPRNTASEWGKVASYTSCR